MIPKIIWTYWIGGEMPEKEKYCIETQKKCAEKFGYQHKIIGNDDTEVGSQYVRDCLSRKDVKGYVKATDYLRCWYVWKYGGIAADGDMEILPGKNFDHLLNERMFVPKDPQGHFGNAAFGSEAGEKLLEDYLGRVERNFRGEGELVYEQGVRGFSDMFYIMDVSHIKILTPDFAFPYNHHTKQTNITDNTVVLHHYSDRWVDKR